MDSYRTVQDLEILKIIGDTRRLDILRLLMNQPLTLSKLGKRLGLHPAKVRYHLKRLENTGLIRYVSSREVRGFVEKYYQATSKAYFVNQVVLPKVDREPAIIALGSHDPALELLAAYFEDNPNLPLLINIPVGSLDGLIALRQGLCHLAGCHLYDPIDKDYNISYVRHFFPDQPVHVITLAHRLQGLLVAPGNPYKVKGVDDLTRGDLTFINRKKGSGTRLWLDQELKQTRVQSDRIKGYSKALNTHSAVAEEILSGKAEVGLGVMAAARECGLDFIPVFKERFDLVVLGDAFKSDLLGPILDYIQTALYRKSITELGGYDPQDTGKEIEL